MLNSHKPLVLLVASVVLFSACARQSSSAATFDTTPASTATDTTAATQNPLPAASSAPSETATPLAFVPAKNAVRPGSEEIESEAYWLKNYYYEISTFSSPGSLSLKDALEIRIMNGLLPIDHLELHEPYENGYFCVKMPIDEYIFWAQKLLGKEQQANSTLPVELEIGRAHV